METRKNRWLLRPATLLVATAGYLLVITFLLTLNSPETVVAWFFGTSGPAMHSFTQGYQLLLHFLSFYLLAILVGFCFKNLGYRTAIFLMIVYAVVTELIQASLPNRHADLGDLLTNFAGIACGIASVWAVLLCRMRLDASAR